MKNKGQGALEYLLIISAAVIIAVIVIALMLGITQQGTGAAEDANVESTYSEAQLLKVCTRDCNCLKAEPKPAGCVNANTCKEKFPRICR